MGRMEVIAEFEANIEEFEKKESRYDQFNQIKEEVIRQAKELAEALKASDYSNPEIGLTIGAFRDVFSTRIDKMMGEDAPGRDYFDAELFMLSHLRKSHEETVKKLKDSFENNKEFWDKVDEGIVLKIRDQMTEEEIKEAEERELARKREEAERLEKIMGPYPEFDELFGRNK